MIYSDTDPQHIYRPQHTLYRRLKLLSRSTTGIPPAAALASPPSSRCACACAGAAATPWLDALRRTNGRLNDLRPGGGGLGSLAPPGLDGAGEGATSRVGGALGRPSPSPAAAPSEAALACAACGRSSLEAALCRTGASVWAAAGRNPGLVLDTALLKDDEMDERREILDGVRRIVGVRCWGAEGAAVGVRGAARGGGAG